MKISEIKEHYRKHNCFPVGLGWRPLVEKLMDDICAIDKDVEVSQIKEKFGGLRFYVSGANDKVYDLISKAEEESLTICEECGTKENVTTEGGWILTLCKKCRKERNKGK